MCSLSKMNSPLKLAGIYFTWPISQPLPSQIPWIAPWICRGSASAASMLFYEVIRITYLIHILVGGLVAMFYFPIYWVANHPNWRTIFFRGVAQPPTSIVFYELLWFTITMIVITTITIIYSHELAILQSMICFFGFKPVIFRRKQTTYCNILCIPGIVSGQ